LQRFSQLKELPFDRTLISGFRPFLVNSFEDEKGNTILNYSDTDQLKFSLLFKQNSEKASIYYNKKNKAVKDIEDELIRVIYEFNDLPTPS